MKRIIFFAAMAGVIFSCSQKTKTTVSMNPFLSAYNTPFDVPPFDKIRNAHYLPAFKEGMKQHDQEIQGITSNPEAATFANTIEALDRSGDLLTRVRLTFFNVKEANTNDSMDVIAAEVAPLLSQHQDAILMNDALFARVKAVYDKLETLGLNPEQNRLVSELYKQFVRGGANLPAEKKEELKKINEELSVLDIQFDKNMLNETNNFKLVIEDKADLSGLPESVLAAAAEEAKSAGMDGKWVFTLQKPSWIPFLTYSDKRELREKLYKAMYNRCNNGNENDNKAVISQYANLRIRKANLMGFPDWASFVLDNNMAKKPENVYDLLLKVWKPALAKAKQETVDMQKMIDKEGGKFQLESWDWWYYAEKVRKEKFDLDENQLRPYFKLENVLDGAFYTAGKLYGLSFNPLENMPVYHPDCKAFEVKDADGSLIGILYTDFYARSSKKGGAWMNNYREQSRDKNGSDIRPIVSINGNFPKPVGNDPSLLSYDDVETLFHEF
ncbi:MAG TPA: M3 family metallopeptidase, partial [Prolixibacteraceae bacterium]|nr:M3 family metallopeptidase [Prolixibacteraceae bacterium]